MSGFLLDTNVVSEVVKPEPNPAVSQWLRSTNESLLYLSVLTIGEIRRGIVRMPDSRRRIFLESWLNSDLLSRFFGRILPIDLAVADRWGRFAGSEQVRPIPLATIDSLLAATAVHYDLTFVTRDSSHHRIPGLNTFDPWKS